MNWELRTLSIAKSSFAREGIETYHKKINGFLSFDIKWFKPERDLFKDVDPSSIVVLCDERGRAPCSRDFASQLQKWQDQGKRQFVFIIGGPFGIDAEQRKKADYVLSLSHLVMNQEVALMVLCEQLFRALTIMNNHPYHND
ncbi:MAG: 23S rRNA (pseudouridine(1915)-N(3))-methyltransferase RlmH [Bdellovibrionales bacterium]|nr:23S rRNA (pseudouridine(1915)-N(3))-methyltransferase RlmH [Bdellovibrionales bacterium]